MDVFSMVLSSAYDDDADSEPVIPTIFRYCHHCQRPIEGHQYQFVPNKFLCGKCWPLRYVLIEYEERPRPGAGDRISDDRLELN
jgi:hypothetical protein